MPHNFDMYHELTIGTTFLYSHYLNFNLNESIQIASVKQAFSVNGSVYYWGQEKITASIKSMPHAKFSIQLTNYAIISFTMHSEPDFGSIISISFSRTVLPIIK